MVYDDGGRDQSDGDVIQEVQNLLIFKIIYFIFLYGERYNFVRQCFCVNWGYFFWMDFVFLFMVY